MDSKTLYFVFCGLLVLNLVYHYLPYYGVETTTGDIPTIAALNYKSASESILAQKYLLGSPVFIYFFGRNFAYYQATAVYVFLLTSFSLFSYAYFNGSFKKMCMALVFAAPMVFIFNSTFAEAMPLHYPQAVGLFLLGSYFMIKKDWALFYVTTFVLFGAYALFSLFLLANATVYTKKLRFVLLAIVLLGAFVALFNFGNPCNYSGNGFCFFSKNGVDGWDDSVFLMAFLALVSTAFAKKITPYAVILFCYVFAYLQWWLFDGVVHLALWRITMIIPVIYPFVLIEALENNPGLLKLELAINYLLYFVLFGMLAVNIYPYGQSAPQIDLPVENHGYYEYCSHVNPSENKTEYFEDCPFVSRPTTRVYLNQTTEDVFNNPGIDAYYYQAFRDIVTNGFYKGFLLKQEDRPIPEKYVVVYAWSKPFVSWLNASEEWTLTKNYSGYLRWERLNTLKS